ncbi:MAG: zinc ribbon domain-containing protein [Chloroflexi bacterium]|nr:zinc ribbon domain-containing protein [Chloroflexota bacterium]
MPLYDYRCTVCGEVFEVRASFKEKEVGLQPACPKCHSPQTQQLLTAGLVIRGGDGGSLGLPACGPDMGPGCC